MEILKNSERRNKTRVEFKTRVVLKADKFEIIAYGSSKDMSLKGIFVNTDKIIPIGERCHIEVSLTGMTEELLLMMKGTIVRKEDSGLGVVFDAMDLDSYTHLKNIVRYNTTEPDHVL